MIKEIYGKFGKLYRKYFKFVNIINKIIYLLKYLIIKIFLI